jgi:hypothetical protein
MRYALICCLRWECGGRIELTPSDGISPSSTKNLNNESASGTFFCVFSASLSSNGTTSSRAHSPKWVLRITGIISNGNNNSSSFRMTNPSTDLLFLHFDLCLPNSQPLPLFPRLFPSPDTILRPLTNLRGPTDDHLRNEASFQGGTDAFSAPPWRVTLPRLHQPSQIAIS